jgi:SAM-dependent methyltransferase
MESKPANWSEPYAAVFSEQEVVDVYHLRPPYPDEVIDVLAPLAGGGRVLDAGCGSGELARRLAPRVSHVDAVDVSAAMLAAARAAGPSGVSWILGTVEDAELAQPYSLVTAGDSIHWFDWERALPRFAELLAPDGWLAIVHRDWIPDELRRLLAPVYERHSWNTDFVPLDAVTELERRGLFVRAGEHVTEPVPWRPTVDELVEVHFSTSGLARRRQRDPEAFASELRAEIDRACRPRGGRYDLCVVGKITWGRPAAGSLRSSPTATQ